jgi:hypothetical protein
MANDRMKAHYNHPANTGRKPGLVVLTQTMGKIT